MQRKDLIFRVFISSTFEDMKPERNALQNEVFPTLREYCRQRNARFQAVDLRWGVSEQASYNQQTIPICLAELRRCQKVSPRPNFLILLGQRYGWIPLPHIIGADEFEQLERYIPRDDLKFINIWYRLDKNASPNEYCLLPRENEFRKEEVWYPIESQIRTILQSAACNAFAVNDNTRNKYFESATHQEINHGALNNKLDSEKHVIAYFREISGAPTEDGLAAKYIDADQNKLNSLKERIRDNVHDSRYHTCQAEWTPDGPKSNLKELCEKVEQNLKQIIDDELESFSTLPVLDRERTSHRDFGSERCKNFVGRKDLLDRIKRYLASDVQTPLIIHGPSGFGKTALIAKATEELPATKKVIIRFIGATPESVDLRSLLLSMCAELGVESPHEDVNELLSVFRNYLAQGGNDSEPIIIFLDALDQLNETDDAKTLNWLPQKLGPNVKLVMSVLNDEDKRQYYDIATSYWPSSFVVLAPLGKENAELLLRCWLNAASRTLQPEQQQDVIEKFSMNGSPLFLKLAFEQARKWKSWQGLPGYVNDKSGLNISVRGLLEDLFTRLEHQHSRPLVASALKYIEASKNGLTEDELMDVLSCDKEVLDDFNQNSPTEKQKPIEQRLKKLPLIVWSRLFADLEPYMTYRRADGTVVMNFYHRQVSDAIVLKYLYDETILLDAHKHLAEYFNSLDYWASNPKDQRYITQQLPPEQGLPNIRKVIELPYHHLKAAKIGGKNNNLLWDKVADLLCNLDFIQVKSAAKLTYDLINDINEALVVIPDNTENIRKEKEDQARMEKYTHDLIAYAEGKITEIDIPDSVQPLSEQEVDAKIEKIKNNPDRADRLRDFRNFLGSEADNLQKYAGDFSHFTIQQAWNYANTGPVGKAAENVPAEDKKMLLIRSQATRPVHNLFPQIQQTLKEHKDAVTSVSITPNGKMAISGSMDNNCILWDLQTGKPIQILKGHTGWVTSVSITPDGKRAISASRDGTCIFWDFQVGYYLKKPLYGHSDAVTCVSITPNGKFAISGSEDETCILWDLQTGNRIQTFEHTGWVASVFIAPDGQKAILASMGGTYTFWDFQTGKHIQPLCGCTIDLGKYIAIAPDGKTAITGSPNKTCIIWDLQTCKQLKNLDCCFRPFCITPDSKIAILSGRERIFDTAGNYACILVNIQNSKKLGILEGHTDHVNSFSVTPDGKKAISGSNDCTCILWDLQTEKTSPVLKEYRSITAVSMGTNDNKTLSYLNDYDTFILNDIDKDKQIQIFTGHTDSIRSVSITPDKKRLISGSKDSTCILWDIQTGKLLKTLKHFDCVNSVFVTPDGKRAISGSEDKTCILWDLQAGKPLKTLEKHTGDVNSVFVTPDGKMAISGSFDKTCIRWNLETKESLKMPNMHNGFVWCVAIGPDGKKAISGSSDETCILWDLKTCEQLKILKGHAAAVNTVSITHDGKKAISGSYDNMCIVWDINTGRPLAKFPAISSIQNICILPGQLIGCTESGHTFILKPHKELLCLGAGIVTIRSIWDFEYEAYQPLSADCPFCGERFGPPQSVLDTIEVIEKRYPLAKGQSPCLELPDEVAEEPGLLSNCPKCNEKLKFNPFIVKGD